MKSHRISTTISEKHWKLLKKHAEIFETQQKTIELALENLENGLKQGPALTLEEKYWMKLKKEKSLFFIDRTTFRMQIETTNIELLNELFIRDKTIEYAIELYFQKSIKECSIKEVIDGLVITLNIANWVDTIDYVYGSVHYNLMITHSLGFTFSKIIAISIENMFKTCGINTESICSTKTIFMKVFSDS